MIQEADIGVGISGVEGMQVDFSVLLFIFLGIWRKNDLLVFLLCFFDLSFFFFFFLFLIFYLFFL